MTDLEYARLMAYFIADAIKSFAIDMLKCIPNILLAAGIIACFGKHLGYAFILLNCAFIAWRIRAHYESKK